MAGLDNYTYTLGLNYFLNGFGDLGGEAFLNLKAAGEQFDEARNFAETDYLAVGDVGHVHFAEKWQHVVLAQAEHFDVFDDDHLVVGDGEERAFEQGFGIFAIAASEKLHRFADPLGSLPKAFPLGIFAEAHDHFLDQVLEAGARESWDFG